MSHPDSPDNRSPLDAWQSAFDRARVNPFLFQLLLKQWQRVLKRLAYFYAQLASLPRRQRRALQRALATSLVGAALLLALSSAPVVHANSITVGGACTLTGAINNANDTVTGQPDPNCAAGNPAGADTIYLTGNITLAATLPNITSQITLEGNGYTISGANSYRVFYVTSTGDFTINNTTIQYGHDADCGGAILNAGDLVITNSTLSGNEAEYGGAICNGYYATVIINNSTLSGNYADIKGGAIFNASNATVTINNSTLSGNYASDDGGAILNANYANLTLTNSTLSGNSVRYNGGAINNSFGAIATLTNSTLSGNSAGDDGGAIFNANSTTLTLNRTLISGNTVGGLGAEIYNRPYGSIAANNYNLFGHSGITNAQAFFGFTPSGTDITATSDGTNPTALSSILNTTLALNGNPNGTFTHALVSGSPALDKALNTACSDPPVNGVDQRGFPRNVPIGHPATSNDCDIGAFELQVTTAVNVTGLRGSVNQKGGVVLKWRTTSETQIAGFNVYRQGKQGSWKQINAQFKSAKHPGDALGDKYRFADKKVLHGKVYRYKIEVHYLDGHTEWTNVVKVKTP